MSTKEMILEMVQQMPEDATVEEILEQISILAAIRQGEAEIDAGHFISHEDVKKRFASWKSSI